MLQQPQSPRLEAQQEHSGGLQLLGNHGAIRGKAAGKEKLDLRDTTRLVELPTDALQARDGFLVLSCPVTGPPAPLSRQMESSQHRDACSTAAHMGITGDPGHGTEGHLLPLTGEHCGGRAQAGLGEPQMLSTSMEAHALVSSPTPSHPSASS